MPMKLKGFNSSEGQLLINKKTLVKKLIVQTITAVNTIGPKRCWKIFLSMCKDNKQRAEHFLFSPFKKYVMGG